MTVEAYKQGMNYEIFICRAHNCWDNSKNGAHLSHMKNLIDAENGSSWVSHLGSPKKQIIDVKKNMLKAFDKYLSMNFTDEEKEDLNKLKGYTQDASSSSILLDIIDIALKITERFK